ncbi:hypothetical protein [Dyella terrae]|nr:hypothetical protein [Dyella terrae]TBR36074.1 hypothetical protein EYV96_15820 [Dyella terrae]
MLQTLIDSFKSHVNERITSPFAGAFVIAWVLVNWKALLVLALSTRGIEDRLDYLSAHYFGQVDALWKPLGLALLGVIAYYLLATLFLALFECYGWLKRVVEQKFDQVRWVEPTTYIKLKASHARRVSDLTDLAADNQARYDKLLAELDAARGNQQKVSADLEESHEALSQSRADLGQSREKLAALNTRCDGLWRVVTKGRRKVEGAVERIDADHEALVDASMRLLTAMGYSPDNFTSENAIRYHASLALGPGTPPVLLDKGLVMKVATDVLVTARSQQRELGKSLAAWASHIAVDGREMEPDDTQIVAPTRFAPESHA